MIDDEATANVNGHARCTRNVLTTRTLQDFNTCFNMTDGKFKKKFIHG